MSEKRVDYFDAKDTVRRLEAVLNKHVIHPPEAPLFPGAHVVDLDLRPSKPVDSEPLSDFLVRRRAELAKEEEELRFLEDVAELRRKYPGHFKEVK